MRIFISLLLSFVILHAYDFNTSRLAISSVSKWQDVDSQIQQFIIKHDKVIKEKFFPVIKQPFSILSEEEKAKFQIPRLNYTRDDMRVLMTYTKYLIDQNRTQEIPEIYVNVIDGINRTDSGSSFISLIFKIVMNRITLESLQYDIDHLSQQDKTKLLSKAPKLFELNLEEFDTTLERNTKDLVKEYKSYLIKMLPKERVEKISTTLEQKALEYNRKFITLKNIEERKKLVQKIKSDKKRFFEKYKVEANYFYDILVKYSDDNKSVSKEFNQTQKITQQKLSDEVIIDAIFNTAFLINFVETREDCREVIEFNQQVLQKLKK